jgi:SAM-dependent methyltransferase
MSLAKMYHAHHQLHMEDLSYWLDLAEQQGSPVLELGCGSGRITIPLAEAGYQIYGIDHDPDMLDVLRSQASAEMELMIQLGDLCQFEVPQRFPLIVLPCNTYSTLSKTQRAAALLHISRHLTPDGVFAFSIPNPALLNSLTGESEPELEESFIHPESGNPVQVSSAWKREPDRLTVTWVYDHLLPDGGVERLVNRVEHLTLSTDTLKYELKLAGYEFELYGDFDGNPYEPESDFLIVEAYRP